MKTKREKIKELETADLLCREAICNAFENDCDSEVAELKARLQEIRRERSDLEQQL